MVWWKIYFWVSLVLSAVGLVTVYGQARVWFFSDWVEIITSIIGLIGLFAFIYKKTIFSKLFWRVFFWMIVVSWFFNLIYVFTPLEEVWVLPTWFQSRSVGSEAELLAGMLLSLPSNYAVYQLGQKNTKHKSSIPRCSASGLLIS